MVAPSDPGILRWVNGRYVFVPARRPTVGETCLLYPIDGRYLAIPLARPGVGDRAILEPISGGRIAVPLAAGAAQPCITPVPSFTWAIDGDKQLTITDTSTGHYDTIMVFVVRFNPFGDVLYPITYPRGVAIPPVDCSEPGEYPVQFGVHSRCPAEGWVQLPRRALFIVTESGEVVIPWTPGDGTVPTPIYPTAWSQEYPYLCYPWLQFQTYDPVTENHNTDFVNLETGATRSWLYSYAGLAEKKIGWSHYAVYDFGAIVALYDLDTGTALTIYQGGSTLQGHHTVLGGGNVLFGVIGSNGGIAVNHIYRYNIAFGQTALVKRSPNSNWSIQTLAVSGTVAVITWKWTFTGALTTEVYRLSDGALILNKSGTGETNIRATDEYVYFGDGVPWAWRISDGATIPVTAPYVPADVVGATAVANASPTSAATFPFPNGTGSIVPELANIPGGIDHPVRDGATIVWAQGPELGDRKVYWLRLPS